MYVSQPDKDYCHGYYVIANVLPQVIAECKIATNNVFNNLTVKSCENFSLVALLTSIPLDHPLSWVSNKMRCCCTVE